MTELLIFTLLATVVALYNILPEHRKVRVNFIIRRRRWQVWVVSLLGIIVAIYAVVGRPPGGIGADKFRDRRHRDGSQLHPERRPRTGVASRPAG